MEKWFVDPKFPSLGQGRKHRGHYWNFFRKVQRDPRITPQSPAKPFEKTPAEVSEKQVSLKSLGEGCVPQMVTLQNFISRVS